jgi:ATP-dependent Zn protease
MTQPIWLYRHSEGNFWLTLEILANIKIRTALRQQSLGAIGLNTKKIGLGILLAVVVAALVMTFSQRPAPTPARWPISEFQQAVQQHKVEKVAVNPDRTELLATLRDGQQKRVNLPSNGTNWIDLLTRNQVDIVVYPQDNNWMALLGHLLFPLLLLAPLMVLVGLLLWRRPISSDQ